MTFAPTPAWNRSWLLAFGALLVAVLTSRPDVLLLAVPFAVHALWGLASRPSGAEEVVPSARNVLVEEGDAVAYRLTTEGWDGYVAAQVQPQRRVLLDPPSGAALGSGETVQVNVEPERWGRYSVEVSPIALTDPSGCWRTTSPRHDLQLTVRPRAQRIAGGSGVARPIGMSGMHRSRRRGEGTELSDVREFAPGDRLRRINWRVTSRLPGVYVNSMLVERDTDVLVVADTALDVGADGEASSQDSLVRAVAGIVQHYCSFGDRVAVHDLSQRIGHIRSGTGQRQVRTVMQRLARARAAGHLEGKLRRVRTLASGTIVFVVTPLLDEAVQAEIVRLRNLGGEVVVVDVLPPTIGADVDAFPDPYLGEAWVLRRLEREELVERLRAAGIPVVAWEGPTTLAAVLQAMEAARSAPRMRR